MASAYRRLKSKIGDMRGDFRIFSKRKFPYELWLFGIGQTKLAELA